ncbi:phosphoribosylanthranilate isomerase [Microbulbifer hydrolyticus]|uniref:N-(5'-phosphoribosyl)anthranilate isomerase n=1 Tax=Microbulbifer hydrolyticus TaxID=48074 RepID=A0A6P1TD75_9GAMM|nr:phosphoribosylanthranilate isomerase [Microbulbifer hydrolyticus]MBB5209843.1 phosphoribosylanthranilate isomerase [Microbulbifer hydrolyticus]QHQ39613.1 phosphoribosylanthranilate isomerase [Microbulbifer hydrolyticus]
MRVKICGITSVEDARLAVEAGADALGLVFYPPSPRNVSPQQAAEIARAVSPFAVLTGLFVDAHPAQVEAVLDQVPLNLLQFHGNENAPYCRQFHRPYIKALRMKPELDPLEAMAAFPDARGILLDAYRKGVPGGTGDTFDWQRVPQGSGRQIVLAGGLNPQNVAAAIAEAQPDAVDVSGGVEAAPGRKDAAKVHEFIRAARAAESSGARSTELTQGV